MASSKIDYLTLLEINEILNDSKKKIPKLVEWGLIPAEGSYKCLKCGGVLKLSKDVERVDGVRWLCSNKISQEGERNKTCGYRVEFRRGTFFANSKLPLLKILGFVSFWVQNASLTLIGRQLKMSMHTLVDWASFCREIVFDNFFTQPEKLGGLNKIVEIDESKFGKRKYHRGHRVEGQWVFGGYERGTGRVFMVAVEKRDSDTLVPLIETWIAPGTTVISDCWKAYSGLSDYGYKHLTVNHSINFVDPVTGAHTNAIESSWRAAKSSHVVIWSYQITRTR